MSSLFKKLMEEASRLTHTGKLQEATQAIQQAMEMGMGKLAAAPVRTARHTATAHPSTPAAAADPWVIDGCVTEVAGPATAANGVDAMDPAPPYGAPPTASIPDGPGRFTRASFSHNGSLHSYKLYIPPAADALPTRALPLVLMLHGCTQNPDDFAAGTGMNTLAREQGFFVLYPEQDQTANAQRCWNWFKPGDQQRDSGEPAWLAALVRHTMAQQRVDARQVFVAGLSAGGAMASILGHTHPDLFAAVGVHSGLACGVAGNVISALSVMKNGRSQPAAVSSVPTIVFHGDADATVHPQNAEAVVQTVLASTVRLSAHTDTGRSAQGQRYTRTTYRHSDGRSLVELWSLHGAGHAWSGGSSAGSYTDPAGPDASAEMWRFFQAHPHATVH